MNRAKVTYDRKVPVESFCYKAYWSWILIGDEKSHRSVSALLAYMCVKLKLRDIDDEDQGYFI